MNPMDPAQGHQSKLDPTKFGASLLAQCISSQDVAMAQSPFGMGSAGHFGGLGGLGQSVGIHKPWPTGIGDHWGGGGWPAQWEDYGEIERAKREWERQQAQKQQGGGAAMDDFLRKLGQGGASGEADRRSAEAQAHACGIEAAEGAVGARHHLRLALGAGHRLGLIRCWAAAAERGFQTELLGKGLSETLMAAALGRDPAQSLAWLAEQGFAPGRALASQAMLAMLASGHPAPPGLAQITELFGAGTLESKALAAIEAACKGLSARASANAEAYEMEQVSRPGKEASKAARL